MVNNHNDNDPETSKPAESTPEPKPTPALPASTAAVRALADQLDAWGKGAAMPAGDELQTTLRVAARLLLLITPRQLHGVAAGQHLPLVTAALPPPVHDGLDPLMVVLLRQGEEVACMTADDTRDAVRIACKLLLDQPELKLADQLCIMRI